VERTLETEEAMKMTRIALAAAMLLSLVAGIAQAGGRAHVSILNAPKDVVAGKTYEVAFSVRPEWPMKNRSLEPIVRAVCGGREMTFSAVSLKTQGQYKASIALPAAGEWTITVDSRFCETRMTPLVLKAEAARTS
jgi:disulfide bond formation protein DsbB